MKNTQTSLDPRTLGLALSKALTLRSQVFLRCLSLLAVKAQLLCFCSKIVLIDFNRNTKHKQKLCSTKQRSLKKSFKLIQLDCPSVTYWDYDIMFAVEV